MPGKDTTEAVAASSEDRIPAPAARPVAARQPFAVTSAAPPVLNRAPAASSVPASPPPGAIHSEAAVRARLLAERLATFSKAFAAGAPPTTGDCDSLLAEVDACLGELSLSAREAPPEARPAFAAVRAALLDQAFAFTTTLQATLPGLQSPAAAPAPRPAAVGAVTVAVAPSTEPPALHRSIRDRMLWGAFALSAALTVGYHGYQRLRPPPVAAAIASYPGAPEGMVLAGPDTKSVKLLVSRGRTVGRAEIERFRKQEEQRGNQVKELSPGVLSISPAPSAPVGRTK